MQQLGMNAAPARPPRKGGGGGASELWGGSPTILVPPRAPFSGAWRPRRRAWRGEVNYIFIILHYITLYNIISYNDGVAG